MTRRHHAIPVVRICSNAHRLHNVISANGSTVQQPRPGRLAQQCPCKFYAILDSASTPEAGRLHNEVPTSTATRTWIRTLTLADVVATRSTSDCPDADTLEVPGPARRCAKRIMARAPADGSTICGGRKRRGGSAAGWNAQRQVLPFPRSCCDPCLPATTLSVQELQQAGQCSVCRVAKQSKHKAADMQLVTFASCTTCPLHHTCTL